MDAYITKGKVHESDPFIDRDEYIKQTFGFDIKKYGVDSGYVTLDIKKYFIENNIFGVFGYRRYGTPESRKEKSKYVYIKELDIYYEKETGEVLEYKGLIDKMGYKKYQNLDKTKIIRRHIHEEWNEQFRENRLSEEGKELYKRRKEHVERSFADIIMGNIVDHTKPGKEKYRPWILRMAVPAAIMMLMLFTVPKANSGLQIAYMLVTNLLMTSVIYTAIAIPYGSLMVLRTISSEEPG